MKSRLLIFWLLLSAGAPSQVPTISRAGLRIPPPPPPRHSALEFENTTTRVLRVKLDPEQGTAIGQSGLFVCVRACELRVSGDGRDRAIHVAAGGTMWMSEGQSITTISNRSSAGSEFLFIEPKR